MQTDNEERYLYLTGFPATELRSQDYWTLWNTVKKNYPTAAKINVNSPGGCVQLKYKDEATYRKDIEGSHLAKGSTHWHFVNKHTTLSYVIRQQDKLRHIGSVTARSPKALYIESLKVCLGVPDEPWAVMQYSQLDDHFDTISIEYYEGAVAEFENAQHSPTLHIDGAVVHLDVFVSNSKLLNRKRNAASATGQATTQSSSTPSSPKPYITFTGLAIASPTLCSPSPALSVKNTGADNHANLYSSRVRSVDDMHPTAPLVEHKAAPIAPSALPAGFEDQLKAKEEEIRQLALKLKLQEFYLFVSSISTTSTRVCLRHNRAI
ncbi:hypothetical protein HDV00_012125 [Rhizophlyctis rosea]|nr:hypothetical protein HDV00_012125 [Rhizophlyctis rosea]